MVDEKKPRDVLLDNLAQARSYEDWEEAAFKLDELFGSDLWYDLDFGLYTFSYKAN
jgi:hypothetical protein